MHHTGAAEANAAAELRASHAKNIPEHPKQRHGGNGFHRLRFTIKKKIHCCHRFLSMGDSPNSRSTSPYAAVILTCILANLNGDELLPATLPIPKYPLYRRQAVLTASLRWGLPVLTQKGPDLGIKTWAFCESTNVV